MGETSYQPTERRPIATRDLAVSHRVATWLSTSGVTANSISLFGMLVGVVTGVLLYFTAFGGWFARLLWITAACCVQLRLLANLFDGMVAIQQNSASPVGELFNEVPDRISDSAILIGFGYSAGGNPTLGWLAALTAVFTAYVRAMGKVAGTPQDYCGPMAKPQRMFVVTMVAIYMGLSPNTWQLTVPAMPWLGIPSLALILIIIGAALTAVRRLLRCAKRLRQASTKG